jgi:anti-sigma factor RsiW
VSDLTSKLNSKEMADLCALADGTLPVRRRAEVEAWVAASPERQDLLERQRHSLVATRALASEPVPDALREAVEAQRRAAGSRPVRRRRLAPRLGLATAFGIAVAIVAVVALSGGPTGPTVAQAAQLATQPATAPAPPPLGNTGAKLALAVQGVSFPNLASSGWHASGVRHGHVGGRAATVVFYSKGARRIGYVIVSGSVLAHPGGGQTSTIGGAQYQTLRLSNHLAVTWQSGGHTCIMLGEASRAELLDLASWSVS